MTAGLKMITTAYDSCFKDDYNSQWQLLLRWLQQAMTAAWKMITTAYDSPINYQPIFLFPTFFSFLLTHPLKLEVSILVTF